MNKFLIDKLIGEGNNISNQKIRKKLGTLSGIVGIFLNLLLFIAKLVVGILSSSIAATADAFNNLSDAGSSIITLLCFKTASSPADKDHPFGHGRIEYVSSLIVSVAIIITGLGFVKSSIEKIFNPETLEFDVVSLSILISSVLIKLWMWRFNSLISKRIKSITVQATANDSLSDATATFTVLIGCTISYLTKIYVDPYAGLIVSVFIILTGSKTLKESIGLLMGKAPDKEFINEIKQFVLSNKKIKEIEKLSVHNYGPHRSAVYMKVILYPNIDSTKINEIIDKLENQLEEKFGCSAIVRAK